MNACATCGKTVEPLVISCSRECALTHWREIQRTHGITLVETDASDRGAET